jgi:hypothetical protein
MTSSPSPYNMTYRSLSTPTSIAYVPTLPQPATDSPANAARPSMLPSLAEDGHSLPGPAGQLAHTEPGFTTITVPPAPPSVLPSADPRSGLMSAVVIPSLTGEILPTLRAEPRSGVQLAGGEVRTLAAPRRPVTDAVVRPAYAHAADYSWLVGTLEPGRLPGTWCIRYCGVDEEDRHGGSVTLIEVAPTPEFEVGCPVRVDGELLHPDGRDLKPMYWTRSITILHNPAP